MMLKSTYKPSAHVASAAALPPGWTEHTAPSGQKYYYHAESKESTYRRPGTLPADTTNLPPTAPPVPQVQLSDPRVANAFMAQYNAPPPPSRGGFGAGRGGRGGGEQRARPQPIDKPRSQVGIPGCAPWMLVYTKHGRRFAFNPEKKASYWRIPDKLKGGILELDQARIRDKASAQETKASENHSGSPGDKAAGADSASQKPAEEEVDSSDEYEEVEVTDDEGEEGKETDGNPSKRQRTEEPGEDDQPVEFSEADIAFQLQAMGEEYGVEDEFGEEWQGDEDAALEHDDAVALFCDLLADFAINPYSPWDKLIEEGKIFDDSRYTALTTMKARKEAWETWSRARIKLLKEQRAREAKTDPRIPYLAFLQERATPKLYWPEFKRKYRKETPMKDPALPDRDREKWYREYIARLKLPQATLRADLMALLRSIPPSKLNNQTLPDHLPPEVLTDMRFVALDSTLRDPLVEAYIQTLPAPPEDLAAAEEDEAALKARQDRRRREEALVQREKAASDEKRRQERALAHGRAALREEERELERAMQVGKRGLQSQLAAGAGEQGPVTK